jgi:hypothetical protein
MVLIHNKTVTAFSTTNQLQRNAPRVYHYLVNMRFIHFILIFCFWYLFKSSALYLESKIRMDHPVGGHVLRIIVTLSVHWYTIDLNNCFHACVHFLKIYILFWSLQRNIICLFNENLCYNESDFVTLLHTNSLVLWPWPFHVW